MNLYLDTHPEDEDALAFFREKVELRKEALKQYAEQYGPRHDRYRQRPHEPFFRMGYAAMAWEVEPERRVHDGMWNYEKQPRVSCKHTRHQTPKSAQIIMSQYGGPDGEMGASMRYLSQRFTAPNRIVAGC